MLGKLWMSLQNSISASECRATHASRSFTPLLARLASFMASLAADDNLFSYRANEAGEREGNSLALSLVSRSLLPKFPLSLPPSFIWMAARAPDSRNNEFIPFPAARNSSTELVPSSPICRTVLGRGTMFLLFLNCSAKGAGIKAFV